MNKISKRIRGSLIIILFLHSFMFSQWYIAGRYHSKNSVSIGIGSTALSNSAWGFLFYVGSNFFTPEPGTYYSNLTPADHPQDEITGHYHNETSIEIGINYNFGSNILLELSTGVYMIQDFEKRMDDSKILGTGGVYYVSAGESTKPLYRIGVLVPVFRNISITGGYETTYGAMSLGIAFNI